jgi:hypothetical protein
MRERLQIVITTVVVFLLGLGVGVLTQRARPMPPPPIGPMGEFGPLIHGGFSAPPPPWMLAFPPGRTISPLEIRQRVGLLEPRIAAFRQTVDSIEVEFRRQLDSLLTPEQRRQLAEFEPAILDRPDNPSISVAGPVGFARIAPPPPLAGCAGEAGNFFVQMVIYRPVLDRLTELLHLNPQQHDRLKALLIDRRNQLLALIDKTPPPSFQLGAVFIQAGPAGPPPPE